ncbi:aGAP009625-PA [Fusobacterium sp. CAG:439]|nr:aGAP009625-PA [Fusobacterium sp. CAG:439]
MRISAIKYYNNINNSYFSGLYINKPSNGDIELEFQSPTLENLSDYKFAEKYYNKKLDEDGKLFDNEKSFLDVFENNKARNVLFTFLRERAQEELFELNSKTNLTEDERNKKEGLKEIIKAFPQSDQIIAANRIPKEISFGGVLTPEQKKKCHIAIHSASAACGAISATMGEGAAVGADTAFLRGTQALMFLYLQNLLNVSPAASLMYAGRQYVMGSYIGVRGAQVLLSWLGIGTHVATAGTASGPVTGAVRGINSVLSTGITEKMGWGYVKSYEQDTMNAKDQLISTAIYGATMGILHFHDHGILDPSNSSDVQTALSKIPKENVSILGEVMHTLTGTINLPRAGTMFTASFLQGVLTTKNLDEKSKKEYFKNLVGMALMNTLFYETLNIPEDSIIRDDALLAIQKMQEELNNTPEVFKEFQEIQQKIIDDLHLENLNTRDFIKQFKDKDLLINLAFTTGEATNILADKWRKRNLSMLNEANAAADAKREKEKARAEYINSKLTPEQKKELDNELNKIVLKTKEDLINKTKSNHALGRIAGYAGTKALLNTVYIAPVKNKDENVVPNLLLFYGPSGLGKTAIGAAIAEDAGTKFKNKTIGMGNEKKTLEWLKKRLEEGEENYNANKRFSIIQLNEFDDFLNDTPDLLDDFLQLVDNSAKKYHTTIFLTTNNPLLINKKILDKVELTIPMGVASKSDIREIVQYYVNNREIDGYNLDEITDEFENVKPDYMYSNAQIENIIEKKLPKNQCNQNDFINTIRSVKPCITKEINEKFENEQKILEKEST